MLNATILTTIIGYNYETSYNYETTYKIFTQWHEAGSPLFARCNTQVIGDGGFNPLCYIPKGRYPITSQGSLQDFVKAQVVLSDF